MGVDQKCIPFTLDHLDDLREALSRPLLGISIESQKNRWVSSLTIWNEDHSGIKIASKMYDLAYKLEVGSLSFTTVKYPEDGPEIHALPKSFSSSKTLQIMLIQEPGYRIESGLKITASDGAEILIVPNAMPYTLAVQYPGCELKYFEPDYNLEHYELENMKKR